MASTLSDKRTARASQVVVSQLNGGLDKAVALTSDQVDKFILATRRTRGDWTPAGLVSALGHSYRGLVTISGGAAGGVAAAPAVGTGPGVALAVADAGAFTVASGLYVLAVCSVYGIDVSDLERRRALMLMVLTGSGGVSTVERIAGRTGAHWGRQLTKSIPLTTIRQINRVLGKNFVTKYGTKQGILVIGKAAPFGIGAGIGAAGNAALATAVISATKRAMGPAPQTFPGDETPDA